MEYTCLEKLGARPSRLGFGCMRFPTTPEAAIDGPRALAMLDEALEPREAQVIRMRYGLVDGEPQPQHAVAKALGISRSYVSRIEKKALEKLRARLEALPETKPRA